MGPIGLMAFINLRLILQDGLRDRRRFLAVLELCKNRKIIVMVKDGHDDFWITMRTVLSHRVEL